jgi:cystathionine beta-lyase
MCEDVATPLAFGRLNANFITTIYRTFNMNFDQNIDRRGTRSAKWDVMEKLYGISPDDGLAMWVADMDFAAPDFLQNAVREQLDIANYGYFADLQSYSDAVVWWMSERHGWQVQPEWMFTTVGLGNGIAITLQALTEPGDHIVTFNPVYHEFALKITKSGRFPTQLPLLLVDGIYQMDFDRYDKMMTGREKLLLISSPHNPAGRVWTRDELTQIGEFCQRHDLLLISDEIHHDLVFPGHTHLPMAVAVPDIQDRLIMMTSASKTFNIAGARTGTVTIPDENLRARFAKYITALDLSPNLFGVLLTRAAYSAQGAAWVDELVPYLDANQQLFNAAMNEIPGVKAMPMQSTYLSWIDFEGTGMDMEQIRKRVYRDARIAATWGPTLGIGGENFLRINIGTTRARVKEAASRLQTAFSDLQ